MIQECPACHDSAKLNYAASPIRRYRTECSRFALRARHSLFAENDGGPAFQFLAAISHHRLEQTDRAEQLLEEANTWLQQQRDRDPENVIPKGHTWQDWVVYLTLQREA